MSEPVVRKYEMRLTSRHGGDDNAMLGLAFDLRREGEDWAPFALREDGSSFLNFLQSIFLCQLGYLRMNATEVGLRLDRVHGLCQCDTTDFTLTRFVVSFAMELRDGAPSADDLAYLTERCRGCPVSRNLHVPHEDTEVVVGVEPSRSLFA